LRDWLNPTDGTTRDWASLQVVFGRGEEYFASDKNGKLEYKEPEVKKPAEDEEKEKVDRQALRRSRTVSFLRPLSQASNRSEGVATEQFAMNRRTSSISLQRASRPPSLSYSTTGSEASMVASGVPQSQDTIASSEPSFISRLASLGSNKVEPSSGAPVSVSDPIPSEPLSRGATSYISNATSYAQNPSSLSTQSQSSGKVVSRPGITSIPEEGIKTKPTAISSSSEPCTCGCHDPPLPRVKRPTYANASVQTDPLSPSPRKALRVDTFSASSWGNNNYSAMFRDVQTPVLENGVPENPVFMGRMMNYFSKPGYQLGDSLASGYHYYEQPVYQYQDEFGEEALR
jgi:hypothetical protein